MMRQFHGVGASAVRSRLQVLPLAAGVAVTIGSLACSALGQATWIGGANGNFNVNANWLGNTSPSQGTLAAPLDLTFFSGNAGAITATNNIGTPWVSNSLTFDINNVNTFIAAGGTSSPFLYQIAGSGLLNMSGLGNAQLANGAVSASYGGLQLAADATFGGTGIGNLVLGSISSSAAVSETGGSHKITVSGGAPLSILRNLTFNGTNTFTGGVTLDGGTIQLGSSASANVFGPAGSTMTVRPTGGAINMAQSLSSCSLGTLDLQGDLRIIGTNTFTLTNGTTTAPAVVTGNGDLYINTAGAGGITIASSSNSYSGHVVIDQSDFGAGAAAIAGNLILTSTAPGGATPPSGSLTGAQSIDVRAGGSLIVRNNASNSLQNGNRIGDNTPVRLRDGTFELDGPAIAGTNSYTPHDLNEQIGALSGAGNNTVYVLPTAASGVVTTLEVASLGRGAGADRGTFNFRSTAGMGDGLTATRAKFIVDAGIAGTDLVGGNGATGTQNINIIPYAAGAVTASDNGSTFVTYGADGIRPLVYSATLSDEYVHNNLAPADPTSNVALNSSLAGPGIGNTSTMNALLMRTLNSTTDGEITGSGTLRITSGAVIFDGGLSSTAQETIATDLDFGTREGIVWTNSFGGSKITGQMHGSGGFTKTGNGNGANFLVLTADNSGLSGQLTVNAGYVQYNQDLALPGSGQIVVDGAGVSTSGGPSAGFYWGGLGASSITRDVAVNTGSVLFKILDKTVTTQVNQGDITISGRISGPGNVILQPQAAPLTGQIWLTNSANTYTGTTNFGSGNIHIAADGSTGVGGAWEMAGGTVIAESSITNSRAINFEANSTIDTKNNSVTLNGPITAFGPSNWGSISTSAGLTKNGTGTLTLSSLANNLAGLVTINAGSLFINGNLGPSNSNNVVVNPGAILGGSGTIYRNVKGYSTVLGNGSTKGGGTVAPGGGAGSSGIMTVWGSLDLANTIVNGGPASTLSMDINGPLAGSGYDQIKTFLENGSSIAQVLLGGAETPTPTTQAALLQLSLGYAPASTDVFWLIVNTNQYQANLGTANTTTGAFAGLSEGSTVILGTFGGDTYTGTISYKGDFDSSNPFAGTGNDVVIYNIVPAPGSMALLVIGGILAVRRKRRTV